MGGKLSVGGGKTEELPAVPLAEPRKQPAVLGGF